MRQDDRQAGRPEEASAADTDDTSRRIADDRPWLKLVGLGMELAGSTLALAGLGYLIDRYRGEPASLGVAFGALTGFAFGMFRFIQKAMRATRQESAERNESPTRPPSSPDPTDESNP